MAGKPREQRVGHRHHLSWIGRALQAEPERRQTVPLRQVRRAVPARVNEIVAQVRLPAPQRRAVRQANEVAQATGARQRGSPLYNTTGNTGGSLPSVRRRSVTSFCQSSPA
jgi:hypothetical protein